MLLGVHWGYFMAKVKSALPAENTYTKKEAGMFLTGMFGQNMIYNIVATGLYIFKMLFACPPLRLAGFLRLPACGMR